MVEVEDVWEEELDCTLLSVVVYATEVADIIGIEVTVWVAVILQTLVNQQVVQMREFDTYESDTPVEISAG